MKRIIGRLIRSAIFLLGMVLSLAFLFSPQYRAMAASATANAVCSVIAALSIAKVSDLNFGEGIQGDPAKTVAPGSAENAENASFNLTGQGNRTFNITLPSDSTVVMTTDDGVGTTKQIGVNSFQSNPATSGSLNASGQAALYVGGTRASLLSNQTSGSYSGAFSVTVVY